MKKRSGNLFKKEKKGVSNKKHLVWLFVSFFIAIQVFFTIYASTKHSQVVVLEQEKEKLSKENYKIQEELARASSLTKIEEKAQELGFKKAEDTLYVKVDDVFVGTIR